jgi:hypothetical protein
LYTDNAWDILTSLTLTLCCGEDMCFQISEADVQREMLGAQGRQTSRPADAHPRTRAMPDSQVWPHFVLRRAVGLLLGGAYKFTHNYYY